MNRTVARALLAVSIVCGWRVAMATDLPAQFPDSTLRRIPVGRPLPMAALKSLGFAPAQAQVDHLDGAAVEVLHFERAARGRVDMLDLTPGSRVVTAVGWLRAVSPVESRRLLAEFVASFGFPDDVIADGTTKAVGWADESAHTRLELVLSPSESRPDQFDLSAVLRSSSAPGPSAR